MVQHKFRKPVKAAVVTGQHPFDVQGFHALFRALPNIEYFPQHLDELAHTPAPVRAQYDVLVFYNFHQRPPGPADPWYEQGALALLEALGESPQGIMLMHHALAAYPDWPVWDTLVGLRDRGRRVASPNQTLRIEVSGVAHPITSGLTSWTLVDETYTMPGSVDGGEVLLTTHHARSMAHVAWARTYKNARVFCLQSGHDNHAFSNLHFRTIVARGIQWCAGRI